MTVRQNLLLGMKNPRRPGRWSMDDVFRLFPLLRERADAQRAVRSGGEQQMLTIALTISRRVYVMGRGRVVFEGTPQDLRANEAVRKEWLEV